MFNKNPVSSVFCILSLFAAVLYQLNGFLLVYCACSHLASAISAMLASMCEYWSCALQSKLSRPPEISRCRAFTWIIVVPVNRVTRIVQARYLGPPSYPGFMWTDKLSKQRNTCALPRDISPHVNRLLVSRNKHFLQYNNMTIASSSKPSPSTNFYYIAKHCTRNKWFIGSGAFEMNNKLPAQATNTFAMHDIHIQSFSLFGKQLQNVAQGREKMC